MKLIGIGALIDSAWEQYRKQFSTLIKISAWTLLITAINIVVILLYPIDAAEMTRDLTGGEIFGIILMFVNNIVFAAIVGIWVVNALITAAHKYTEGASVNMKVISKSAWKLFFPVLWVRILLIVAYVVAAAIPVLLFWLVTMVLAGWLPTFLMFLLLFISLLLVLPAIALVIYLAFAIFAAVMDGKRGTAALRYSASLLKNRFWPVLARLLVPKLLYFGVFFLAQFLLVIIVGVVMYGIFQDTTAVAAARIEWIALYVSYAVLFILLNPMLLVTDHIIYNNLKK